MESFSSLTSFSSTLTRVVALVAGGTILTAFDPNNAPVVPVNGDESLMSVWPSEAVDAEANAAPNCQFWNYSVVFRKDLCSHFVVSRSSSMPSLAINRALACAGHSGSDCILSAEIGLAIPAAFLFSESAQRLGISAVLAPRLLSPNPPPANLTQHVRIAPPTVQSNNANSDVDELFERSRSETFLLAREISIEYLDESRRLKTAELRGDDAYCVQLLRLAFEPACWKALD
jgi:hypothetical protein